LSKASLKSRDRMHSGLEVNANKAKYIVMSRVQTAGRSHKIKIYNSSFERVEESKYLGTTLTNHYSIQEEVKSILKSGNAYLSFSVESFVFQFAIQKFKDLKYTEL
jgi:hypothetical protein